MAGGLSFGYLQSVAEDFNHETNLANTASGLKCCKFVNM